MRRSRITVCALLIVAIVSCVASGDPETPRAEGVPTDQPKPDPAVVERNRREIADQSVPVGDPLLRDDSGDAVWFGIDMSKPLRPHVAQIVHDTVDTSSIDMGGIKGGRLPPAPSDRDELVLKPIPGWTYASFRPHWQDEDGKACAVLLLTADLKSEKEAIALIERTTTEMARRFGLRPDMRPAAFRYGRTTIIAMSDGSSRDKPRSRVVRRIVMSQANKRVFLSVVFDKRATRPW